MGTRNSNLGRTECPPPPACDDPVPAPGPATPWRHSIHADFAVLQGSPRHRGRDLYLRASDAQWALAKFAYGPADKDLEDEDVDVYLERGCASWEWLGTATTTGGGSPHASVQGVDDDGGRVYFEIPSNRRLDVGRHRIHFIVRGDQSTADQFIDVLPDDARIAVSDVDGTLTSSENAEVWDVLLRESPDTHPGAPDALWALARRGYHIFYLTARPEWLTTRTREWLESKGFPPGNVHTTLTFTGATGASAQAYKTAELTALVDDIGSPPAYGFGNRPSDVATYSGLGMDPSHCYYYQLDNTDLAGGTDLQDYRTLVDGFRRLDLVCPAPLPTGSTDPSDAGGPGAGGSDPCASHLDCETCAAAAGCGWCQGAGRCASGDDTGSFDGLCTDTGWAWSTVACGSGGTTDAGADPDAGTLADDGGAIDAGADPDAGACESNATCGACAAQAGCGWCTSTASCAAGTASGSADGTCTDAAWVWTTSACM